MDNRSVTIGVLGGMGPEASAEFHRLLILKNPARTDQEHCRILVLDDPHIPDRTRFILGSGEDPRPALREKARQLESYGASFIAIPCNTAHVFWEDVQAAVSVPVLHIIRATVEAIPAELGRIALLATRGTIAGGIYASELEDRSIEALIPDAALQKRVDRIIHEAKAGSDPASLAGELLTCCRLLAEQGAEGAILGCTELGLLKARRLPPLPLFDSLGILADAALAEARRLESSPAASTG